MLSALGGLDRILIVAAMTVIGRWQTFHLLLVIIRSLYHLPDPDSGSEPLPDKPKELPFFYRLKTYLVYRSMFSFAFQ